MKNLLFCLLALLITATNSSDAQTGQRASDTEQASSKPAKIKSAIIGERNSDRIAIVIGNNDYPNAPLYNAAQDAYDVSEMIASHGYKVIRLIDANSEQIAQTVDGIESSLYELAIFYFAGHAVEFEGVNYALSAGVTYGSFEDVQLHGFALQELVEVASTKQIETNILILDACRDFPFADGGELSVAERISGRRARVGGLSKLSAPANTLIAYSTSPGYTASDGVEHNSPYTRALLTAFENIDQPFELVFQNVRNAVWLATQEDQVPWSTSSIISSDACLKGPCRQSDADTMASESIPIGYMARTGADAASIRRRLASQPEGLKAILSEGWGKQILQENLSVGGVNFDFAVATLFGGNSQRGDMVNLLKLHDPQVRLTTEIVEQKIQSLDSIDRFACRRLDWKEADSPPQGAGCNVLLVVGRRENAQPDAIQLMKLFNQSGGASIVTYNTLDEMAQETILPRRRH